MQYGEAVPQGKSNSSFEVVTFLWINVSSYNFNIMNTYMNLQPSPHNVEKTSSIFQRTISRLPVKAKKIHIK